MQIFKRQRAKDNLFIPSRPLRPRNCVVTSLTWRSLPPVLFSLQAEAWTVPSSPGRKKRGEGCSPGGKNKSGERESSADDVRREKVSGRI